MTLRQKTFEYLDATVSVNRTETAVSTFLFALIMTNVIAVLLASVDHIGERWAREFKWLEVFSVAVFTVEYLLRVWSAPEDPTGRYRSFGGRLRFMITPMALVDLLAVAPFYAAFFVPAWDLRFLRALRLIRMLKLVRYSASMDLLRSVVRREGRTLVAALVVMLVLLVLASSLMYLVEGDSQPDAFSSIPEAMWWGMITLTTVGYGDVVPQTDLGRALGMLIALFGVGTFALPTGILASGFMEQARKRDFLKTWHTVAALPLFQDLNATQIAEVMDCLRTRNLQRGEILFRAGEDARGMYFVITGQLEVKLENGERKTLGPGDFVGEIGLLRAGERTATVRAAVGSALMYLDREDFENLLNTHPTIHQAVAKEAGRRLKELEEAQRS